MVYNILVLYTGKTLCSFVKDGNKMSASKEKRVRQSKKTDMLSKRTGIENEKEKQDRKFRRNTWLVIIAVAVFAIFVLIFNSNLFYTGMPAIKINNTEYSAAEATYYYKTAYFEFTDMYGEYVQYFFSTDKPLKDQQYSEEKTWADYFEETALESMKRVTMLCDEAEKAGFTLSQEDIDSLNASIESLRTQIMMSGSYANLNQYFFSVYGKGCDEEVVKRCSERAYLASSYYSEVYDGFTYTDGEIENYYNEHADEYDNFNYLSCYVTAIEDEENGVDSEAAMAIAKAAAETIAKAETQEKFKAIAADVTDSSVDTSHTSGKNLSSTYGDWFTDAARREGDTTTYEYENGGVYAFYFISREDNNYKTINVRHILASVTKDDNGEYTDEAKAEALEKIESIYNEWLEGDATEDSFGQLAMKYTDDTGSYDTGGLYENVYKYAMVEEFNNFCFEPGRKPGDVGIVYGASSSYEGYHLIYFVGEDEELYKIQIARNDMRSDDYNIWEEEQLSGYEFEKQFAYRFANKV